MLARRRPRRANGPAEEERPLSDHGSSEESGPSEEPEEGAVPGRPSGPPPYPGASLPRYPEGAGGTPPPFGSSPGTAPPLPGQPPYGQPPPYWQAPPPPGTPPYGQPPPYGQAPPYGQPPPYGQAPYPGPYGEYGATGAPPLAGYWPRAGGWLIDGVILFVVNLVLSLPFRHHARIGTHQSAFALGPASIIGVILFIAYGAILCGLPRGQTLGMMAVRVRAIDARTGGPIGFGRALGRAAFAYLMFALLVIPGIVDLLFPAWDRLHQTLHDKVTSTVVVKV